MNTDNEIDFKCKIGKFCFHEKNPLIIYKLIDGNEDHVVLKQAWPKTDDESFQEYPMRYFNNHFISTEPKN